MDQFLWGRAQQLKHKSGKGRAVKWKSLIPYHCHVWNKADTPGPTPLGKLLNLPEP